MLNLHPEQEKASFWKGRTLGLSFSVFFSSGDGVATAGCSWSFVTDSDGSISEVDSKSCSLLDCS